jgi:carboxyl-terminal processing protease
MRVNRTTRLAVLALVITGLVIGAFGAGIGATWLLIRPASPDGEQATAFALFWEAWHLVEKNFYGDLPDMHQVAWGAIRGALHTLNDPHTTFLEPQPRQREKERLSGQFGGIGAYVNQAEGGTITLDPMPDLPAERAGVVKGDVLLRVDDTEITPEMSADDVAQLIRGEVGSIVRLTLARQGEPESILLEVQRQEIPSPSVEWYMLEQAEAAGYVRLALFSGRTALELEEALADLQSQGMTRLVLDLRGNGGGLFDASIDVASQFLPNGVVAYQLERGGKERTYQVSRKGILVGAPLVVLVDGATASASEIVAGALQDRGRAVLVGEKTFGKGTVQTVYDLSDGSSVHITYAEWLTPHRRQISGQGLAPDLEVTISEEDRSQGRDTQLERAIEYLVSKADS